MKNDRRVVVGKWRRDFTMSRVDNHMEVAQARARARAHDY